MAEPVKVTVTDPETGEVLAETVVTDDYVLVCAGTCRLTYTQASANGTHVLTIKGSHRALTAHAEARADG